MDEILVEVISEKHGTTSDGRAWTRYALKDGNGEWYSTFDKALVERLQEGKKARIQYESKPVNGRVVKNLVASEPVEESPIAARTEEGGPDWDMIGLRKTRCALWAAFFESQLATSIYLAASKVEGRDPMDHVLVTGTRCVVRAEKDIFEREPGDDGIPFLGNGDIEI